MSTTLAMMYLDDNEAVLTGYVYKVLKKWPNGSNINQWIPKQTGTAMKWAYSLHLYDENGSFLGSEGAQREKAGSDVMLYPNPVHDNHTLSLKASGTVKIDLIDMQGQTVFSESVPDSGMRVAVRTNLASGYYLVRYSGDRNMATEALVINRK